MGDTIFVEQGAALMLAPPSGGAVGQRFGKKHNRTGWRLRNNHTGHLFGMFSDLFGQLVVALMTTRDATKSAIIGSGIGQIPGHDNKTVVDLVAAEGEIFACLHVDIARGGPVIGMKLAS